MSRRELVLVWKSEKITELRLKELFSIPREIRLVCLGSAEISLTFISLLVFGFLLMEQRESCMRKNFPSISRNLIPRYWSTKVVDFDSFFHSNVSHRITEETITERNREVLQFRDEIRYNAGHSLMKLSKLLRKGELQIPKETDFRPIVSN